jgi:hypothetical protein
VRSPMTTYLAMILVVTVLLAACGSGADDASRAAATPAVRQAAGPPLTPTVDFTDGMMLSSGCADAAYTASGFARVQTPSATFMFRASSTLPFTTATHMVESVYCQPTPPSEGEANALLERLGQIDGVSSVERQPVSR